MNKLKTLATLLAVAASIGLANAITGPTLTLTVGADTVTVIDGGVGDVNTAIGAVTYVGGVGGWIMNITTGLTKPVSGSITRPDMDVNSVDVSSTGAGMLVIEWSDLGFDATGGNFFGNIGGTTIGTVDYSWNVNGAEIGSLGPFNPANPITAFSGYGSSGAVGLSPTDVLTQKIQITHSQAGTTSLDASLTVPDGGMTMALFGFALIGVEGLRRKMGK